MKYSSSAESGKNRFKLAVYPPCWPEGTSERGENTPQGVGCHRTSLDIRYDPVKRAGSHSRADRLNSARVVNWQKVRPQDLHLAELETASLGIGPGACSVPFEVFHMAGDTPSRFCIDSCLGNHAIYLPGHCAHVRFQAQAPYNLLQRGIIALRRKNLRGNCDI